jgi:hypothetical protein
MGALTAQQKRIMRDAGFIDREINHFDNARTVDGKLQDVNFEASNFQDMIRHRREYIINLKRMGWNELRIAMQIRTLYVGHASHRTAYMLLRLESSPSAKYPRVSDTDMGKKLIDRSRVSKSLGIGYGRKMRSVKLPRYIPKPLRFPNM